MASPVSRAMMPIQQRMVVEGQERGFSRQMRLQEHVEGKQLKELGFSGLMQLDKQTLINLRSLIVDSIKCYLKHGLNFDLFGSDERDAIKKTRTLNIRRMIFPLRNSSNIIITDAGPQFIDPETLGYPNSKQTLRAKAFQLLIFASSVTNYFILTAKINSFSKQ